MSKQHGFAKTHQEWIYIRDLRPHPRVQRPFDGGHARRIRDNFDPEMFGILAVNREPGGDFVFDGQHRLWAAREFLGEDQKLLCQVYDNLPDERLAGMFLGRNKVRAQTAVTKFKMGVMAGHETPVAVAKILDAHGVKLNGSAASSAGTLRAAAAAEGVYTKHGKNALDFALRVARRAWAADDPDSLDGTVLRALGLLSRLHGAQIDEKDLVRKIAKFGTAAAFIGSARNHARGNYMTIAQAAVEKAIYIYNKGRRTNVIGRAPAGGGHML